ncbi:MAG: hypothetical protein GY834_12665, partial [Bacteroidetes bacterium]|nr:hypothetical protein [Bacteroidota bacterium]
VALHGIAGGGLAEMSGGDFRDGAMLAGSLAVMAYGYNKFVDGRNPTGQTSSGDALHKPTQPEHRRDMMNRNPNSPVFGRSAGGPQDSKWRNFISEHRLRWIPNNIPFANDLAFLHDFFGCRIFTNSYTWTAALVPTMPFAAVWTFGAATAYYASYTSAIASGIRHD